MFCLVSDPPPKTKKKCHFPCNFRVVFPLLSSKPLFRNNLILDMSLFFVPLLLIIVTIVHFLRLFLLLLLLLLLLLSLSLPSSSLLPLLLANPC